MFTQQTDTCWMAGPKCDSGVDRRKCLMFFRKFSYSRAVNADPDELVNRLEIPAAGIVDRVYEIW